MVVVVYVEDIFFISKIEAVADSLQVSPVFIRSKEEFLHEKGQQHIRRLLIDLTTGFPKYVDFIRFVKQEDPSIEVVAFLRHTQIDLQKQAKAAGADRVLPRSEFAQQLPNLLVE